MRITPIRPVEISFKGVKFKKPQENVKQQESAGQTEPSEEITVEKLYQEAQDRYVKEHQAMYEAWDKNIHRPQKYQKEEGKVDDGKDKK